MRSLLQQVISRSYPLQRVIGCVPYTLRYEPAYSLTRRQINRVEQLDAATQKQFVFDRIKTLVAHAVAHNPFYREFYRAKGFDPRSLRRFEDIPTIPIVTKQELRACPLENRSHRLPGMRLSNTGGTSGQPLSFYVPRNAAAFELAHIHTIWQRLGYAQRLPKLSFRGANLGTDRLVFGPGQNEYIVNTYASPAEQCQAIATLLRHRPVYFLHGYPSLICHFAETIQREHRDILAALRHTLKGVFLGSEYPAPHYRQRIREVFTEPIMAWYGHSEMAVLAYEKNRPGEYEPFLSYGYCEAVPGEREQFRLVGTSFSNLASPFIRYDTGDGIQPVRYADDGLLSAFTVREGRLGEHILDRHGHPISLTALIFGRHHRVFNEVDYIQISQAAPGQATIHLTVSPSLRRPPLECASGFDGSHVDIQFDFQLRDQPVRSASGKIPLLIPSGNAAPPGAG